MSDSVTANGFHREPPYDDPQAVALIRAAKVQPKMKHGNCIAAMGAFGSNEQIFGAIEQIPGPGQSD